MIEDVEMGLEEACKVSLRGDLEMKAYLWRDAGSCFILRWTNWKYGDGGQDRARREGLFLGVRVESWEWGYSQKKGTFRTQVENERKDMFPSTCRSLQDRGAHKQVSF